jgi:hypothetical protein
LVHFADAILGVGAELATGVWGWARRAFAQHAGRSLLAVRREGAGWMARLGRKAARIFTPFAGRRERALRGLFSPGYVPPKGAWWRPPPVGSARPNNAAEDEGFIEVQVEELLPRSSPPPLPRAARAQAQRMTTMRARLTAPDLTSVPRATTN